MSTTSNNASPAYPHCSPSLADVSGKDFDAIKRASTLCESEYDPQPVRKPSHLAIACTVLFLLIVYSAWSVWLYYYCQTHVWPLPRGPLNSTDGLLHRLSIATKILIVVLGLVSLIVPFVLFMRTRRPGRERSLVEFNAWILFCAVMAAIPVVIYYIFLCYMQNEAFSSTCDAGEEITAYFEGSTHGLGGDGTTAKLYSTANPGLSLGVYALTSTGYSGAAFVRIDVAPDAPASEYFRVEYFINEKSNYTTATAYTSANGTGVSTMSGNLSEMHVGPPNATLRAVGEVMQRPLNFRLVDNPPVAANGTVEGLGTIGKDVVLRSLATNPWSCRSLKLCARTITDPESRAKTLIAMGWALYKHAEYAFVC